MLLKLFLMIFYDPGNEIHWINDAGQEIHWINDAGEPVIWVSG